MTDSMSLYAKGRLLGVTPRFPWPQGDAHGPVPAAASAWTVTGAPECQVIDSGKGRARPRDRALGPGAEERQLQPEVLPQFRHL